MKGFCIHIVRETFWLTIPIIPNIHGIRMDITGYRIFCLHFSLMVFLINYECDLIILRKYQLLFCD